MLGADGEVYAVAQGTLAVGGFVATGAAETVVKGVPQVAVFQMVPSSNENSP